MARVIYRLILSGGAVLVLLSIAGIVGGWLSLKRSEGWTIYLIGISIPFLLIALCMVAGILLAPKNRVIALIFLGLAALGFAFFGLGTPLYFLPAMVILVGCYFSLNGAYSR